MAAAASPAPVSPSSSNASVRKKLKPNGPKLRQPKTSSTTKSSQAPEEIEIEIAEVLYGMRQPQVPSKQEIMAAGDSIKVESREGNKSSEASKATGDAKSRVSSPISDPSQSAQRGIPPWPICVAPKRKKPRLVKYDSKYEDSKPSYLNVQNNPISSSKTPTDQPAKTETSSANLEKNAGSSAENGVASDTAQSQPVLSSSQANPDSIKLENSPLPESNPATEKSENRDLGVNRERPQSPKKESPSIRLDDKRENTTATRSNPTTSELESQREEKFEIDLMAPPPSRSSPERDGGIDYVAVDAKAMAIDTETEIKPVIKEDAKSLKVSREETIASSANVETEKLKANVEEDETKKPIVVKERNIDLHHQLDLEKTDRDSGIPSVSGSKPNHHARQLQQPNSEKAAQSGSLPLPMSMAGWPPGGLPPMGYMAPLPGVVSMDGSAVSSAAIQPSPFFAQPRPKRCATHWYIAKQISYHQQIMKMNSFWPAAAAAAAGSGSLYGAKACNLNVLPPADLHGNIPGRGLNSVQDKGQSHAMFPGHAGKDKASQAATVVDAAQRKPILLQQALPTGAPSNLLQAPAFIIPLSQQQVAASSVRPGSVKSPPAPGNTAPSSVSNPTPAAASGTAATSATTMTFNFPNMNETQYLAINAYPFPIPAHVGAAPAYRGAHPQAMPSFFNGPFYSTFHPSQLPQQQPPSHSQQSQQPGHQNPSMSSGSSTSQKHLQNQQQHRPQHAGGFNVGNGSLQGFPASKNDSSSQSLQLQQRQQQQQNQHAPHPGRRHESEMGGEDSPSTADSRVSRPSMSIYGQNFAMPIHAPNFAIMTPASVGNVSGNASGSGSNNEKKQQQSQQGSKSGLEQSQAFAMSFASINGATGDISSLAQQHPAIFQSVPGYQNLMVAAAQVAAQQKKSYRGSEEGKIGGDSSNAEEERKNMAGKGSTLGQSIAFSRTDMSDASGSALPGTTVVDSSARTLNLGSNPSRSSTISNAQQQMQRNQQQQAQQQQQQMMQIQKQHQQQLAAVAARTKTPATSNGGGVYSDHLNSSMAAKFHNPMSTFPNLVHSSSSPAQSPQWKNSARTTSPQLPSSSSTSSSLKNLSQQQGRTQQGHTQISFAANPKPSAQPASSNQSPSPPVIVGSPTTSSVSKSAGGSPRTTSTSTGNKVGQASSLSSQQAKNSQQSIPNMKSSPVGGGAKNVPSILGSPHITSSSNSGSKSQLSQHQQLSKQTLQQAQLYFSTAYAQAPHSNSPTTTAAPTSGYYTQRRRPDQQQPSQGSSGTSSSGMLSLCPSVTLPNSSTSDPAKAVAAAAAAGNMKGGGLPSQALMHPHSVQFAAAQPGNAHQLMQGFSYVHSIPTVQVKPAEQKQPAGE